MVVPDVLAVDGVAVDLDGVLECDRAGAGVLLVGVLLVGVPLVGALVGVPLVGALVGVPLVGMLLVGMLPVGVLVGFTPDMSVSIWLTVLDEGLGTEA